MYLNEFVELVRNVYYSGECSIALITRAVGAGDNQHIISQLVRGERFEDCPGPRATYSSDDLLPLVTPMRNSYAAGRSLEDISRIFNVSPLLARRIVSGSLFRYTPGPIDRNLLEFPNTAVKLQLLTTAAKSCPEWGRLLTRKREEES